MVEVGEDLERLADDGVAALAPNVRDEPDAARIVLVARIVKALAWG
jgi:hypothetical protein